MDMEKEFTILVAPTNAAGHINGSGGLALRVAELVPCRIVFVTIGPIISSNLKDSKKCEFITIDPHLNADKYVYEDPENQWPLDKLHEKVKELVEDVQQISPVARSVRYAKIFHSSGVRNSLLFANEYKRITEEVKPDLIIIDQVMANVGLISNPNIPWVNFVSLNPLGIFGSVLENGARPLMNSESQLLNKKAREALRKKKPDEWKALVNKWIEDQKVFLGEFPHEASLWNKHALEIGSEKKPTDQLGEKSPFMNVYMYPKALDYTQDDDILRLPSDWFNCETTLATNSTQADENLAKIWLEKIAKLRSLPGNSGKPLVYFSLGSLASAKVELMKRFVDMLANDTKRLYIISKGCHGDSYELNSLNMIGADYVPQTFILQQIDMAIIHGGNNSLTECMYFGVPCIVMPIFADQHDNAQRVKDLNLGRRLNVHNCTKDDLMTEIDEILGNKSLKIATKKISNVMQQTNECGKVARLLVDLIIKWRQKRWTTICKDKVSS